MNPANQNRADLEKDLDATASAIPEHDDPRLLAAMQEYLAAMEAGQRPNRQEFLKRHAEIAAELAVCLDGLAFVNSAAAQMHASNAGNGSPAVSAVDADLATVSPLGDFRLVREIGRGGMGVVYEATQLSLGRRVAVKVLPFAAALDTRQLQRFKNEAQAAAQLHHTNIVPVYAVGCERSVHYYAMQLIEGRSLAQVIREMREAAGLSPMGKGGHSGKSEGWRAMPVSTANGSFESRETGNSLLRPRVLDGSLTAMSEPAQSLSLMRASRRNAFHRAVARLGLQAAEALDYAHQQGVVHRDIKPENLLLDVRGSLWITDFGLAQFYAESGLTQTGDLLGTLRYMSPEQASGRAVVLDQRTDIYSLGLTLYELLTLERAIPGQTREQLLHQIGAHEPRALRSIDRTLPPELETIIAKTAAKDPADRYPTAGALAEDLRRFLQDEPILARPPSLWDRSVKWTRRHRSLAMSGLVMLLLVAVGLLVSTLLVAREQAKTKAAYVRERDRATEANEQRARAEASFKQARDAVDFFSHIAADEMGGPQFGDVRKEMLQAALTYYQGFLEDRRDDPTIGIELDKARNRVSEILGELAAEDEFYRVLFRLRPLLYDKSVQEELQLTPEQIAKLGERPRDPRPRGPGLYEEISKMTREQRREKYAREAESMLSSILVPSQIERLRQISRQLRGIDAFRDSDVVDTLRLTREQRESIREIASQYYSELRRHGGPRQETAAAAEVLQQYAVGNVMDKLTLPQVDAWKSLIGDPFTGSIGSRDGGFGPPPRRGPEPR